MWLGKPLNTFLNRWCGMPTLILARCERQPQNEQSADATDQVTEGENEQE
jgi:hypothetical protein